MTLILSIIVFALLIGGLEVLSRRHCLDGLKYDVETKPRVVECDEVFEMRSTVENNKKLPVLFMKMIEYIPADLAFDDKEAKGLFKSASAFSGENTTLHQSLYAMGNQRITRVLHVSLPKRGRYLLRGARLTAGDLLGIHEETMHVDLLREIVVKPKPVEIGSIERSFGGYLGDISVQRFINPDPISTVGFREYTGREPRRDISWPQSLRMNRLMVKQYDYTADERSSVLVDINGGTKEEIEACYSVARSVCEYLDKKRIVYGFYTNAVRVTSDYMENYIPDGLGKVHLDSVLEQLGRADYYTWCSTGNLLQQVVANHTDTRSYVMITPHPQEKQGEIRPYEQLIGRKIFTIDASLFVKGEEAHEQTD